MFFKKKGISEFTSKEEIYSHFVELKKKKLNYVLINVEDTKLEKISSDVKTILDSITVNDFLVTNIISSFILILTEFKTDEFDKKVHQMLNHNKRIMRLVYGTVDGGLTNLGNENYQIYGPIIPGLNNIIDVLLKMDYGEMKRCQ